MTIPNQKLLPMSKQTPLRAVKHKLYYVVRTVYNSKWLSFICLKPKYSTSTCSKLFNEMRVFSSWYTLKKDRSSDWAFTILQYGYKNTYRRFCSNVLDVFRCSVHSTVVVPTISLPFAACRCDQNTPSSDQWTDIGEKSGPSPDRLNRSEQSRIWGRHDHVVLSDRSSSNWNGNWTWFVTAIMKFEHQIMSLRTGAVIFAVSSWIPHARVNNKPWLLRSSRNDSSCEGIAGMNREERSEDNIYDVRSTLAEKMATWVIILMRRYHRYE